MKKTSTGIILAIVWIMGMTSLYYWGHKPFDLDQVMTVSRGLLDLVVVAMVILLAGGIGRWIFSLWKSQPFEKTSKRIGLWNGERAVLHAAAGLGVLSLIWLLLGILGLYYRITAWLVLLTGLLLFRRTCLDWWKDFDSFSYFWQKGRKFDRILILFLFFMLALQVIWAAAPPIKYDALTYHLQLPRQYLMEHRFVFVADNLYWGHPQLGEMLFTWMMLLNRGETCALMGAGWGALSLMGIIGTVRRLLALNSSNENSIQINQTMQPPSEQEKAAIRAGLMAAVAVACGATFRGLCSWAYVDLLSALMGWAALACVLTVFEENIVKWSIWAGIFCGFAISTKWTAGIAAAAVFLYLFFARKKVKISWWSLILAVSMTVIVVLPWLVKNVISTGSPVYPYFFATPLISEQRLQAASGADGSVGVPERMLFPVTSTIFGWDNASGFGADLGPLLVLLAIPGLWPLCRRQDGGVILIGLILCWVVIAASSFVVNHLQQTRLFFVLLPWAGVAAGMGWKYLASLKSKVIRIESLMSTLVILGMVFISFQELTRMEETHPLGAVLGLESQDEYKSRATGWYYPAVNAIKDLPEGSKTLLLWEARGYYAPLNSTADLWIDRWRMDYWNYGSAENILDAWAAQGYTHVLLYKSGADLVREGDTVLETAGWDELDRLSALLSEPQSFGGIYELYSLMP